MRHDWSPESLSAFRFTISVSERLNREIIMFGKDEEPEEMSVWKIPSLADEELTTVSQIYEFVEARLVSTSAR